MPHKAPGRSLRRPPRTTPSLEAIDNFVSVGDVRDVSNIQDVQNVRDAQDVQASMPIPTRSSSDVVRRDGRQLKRTTVYLTPENHKRLKKAARLTGTDGSSLINKLLAEQLPGIMKQSLLELLD